MGGSSKVYKGFGFLATSSSLTKMVGGFLGSPHERQLTWPVVLGSLRMDVLGRNLGSMGRKWVITYRWKPLTKKSELKLLKIASVVVFPTHFKQYQTIYRLDQILDHFPKFPLIWNWTKQPEESMFRLQLSGICNCLRGVFHVIPVSTIASWISRGEGWRMGATLKGDVVS